MNRWNKIKENRKINIMFYLKNIFHSRAIKVKSTSVDNDKINGPCFWGS